MTKGEQARDEMVKDVCRVRAGKTLVWYVEMVYWFKIHKFTRTIIGKINKT